jgi:hypothetical protein
MKIIKGDLVLTENTTINDDVMVEGNVRCQGGVWDLTCWDLNCRNLNCEDLTCWDLNCKNLNCKNLNCCNLTCWDLNCKNLNCEDLTFYAVAIAHSSFKCKSWKARRDKFVIKCLDGEIEIKPDKKFCDKCGQEVLE